MLSIANSSTHAVVHGETPTDRGEDFFGFLRKPRRRIGYSDGGGLFGMHSEAAVNAHAAGCSFELCNGAWTSLVFGCLPSRGTEA